MDHTLLSHRGSVQRAFPAMLDQWIKTFKVTVSAQTVNLSDESDDRIQVLETIESQVHAS